MAGCNDGNAGATQEAAERESGLPVVTLGPQVLRAETAAVAAATLWTALRAGIVTPEREL